MRDHIQIVVQSISSKRHTPAQGAARRHFGSSRLVGFPINLTYTDVQPILDKVMHTNLWQADGPKIQFAIATYVHAYPNDVCSVWVYIVAVEDLRAGSATTRTVE